MPYYHIENDFCKAGSMNSELDWLIMYHLGKPVNDDKDGIICSPFQFVDTSKPVTKIIDKSFQQCVGTGNDCRSP